MSEIKNSNKPWAHRVVSKVYPDGRTVLGIHTATYEPDDLSAPSGISETPSALLGLDIDELKDSLIRCLHSTTLPVLKYEDFHKDAD